MSPTSRGTRPRRDERLCIESWISRLHPDVKLAISTHAAPAVLPYGAFIVSIILEEPDFDTIGYFSASGWQTVKVKTWRDVFQHPPTQHKDRAMQSDRELLELAAKAYGLVGFVPELREPEGWICVKPPSEEFPYRIIWAPLTDDGDALRLAVKLRIQVTPGTYNKDEFTAYHPGRREAREYWSSQKDEAAATRRAITRAAAIAQQGVSE